MHAVEPVKHEFPVSSRIVRGSIQLPNGASAKLRFSSLPPATCLLIFNIIVCTFYVAAYHTCCLFRCLFFL